MKKREDEKEGAGGGGGGEIVIGNQHNWVIRFVRCVSPYMPIPSVQSTGVPRS